MLRETEGAEAHFAYSLKPSHVQRRTGAPHQLTCWTQPAQTHHHSLLSAWRGHPSRALGHFHPHAEPKALEPQVHATVRQMIAHAA